MISPTLFLPLAIVLDDALTFSNRHNNILNRHNAIIILNIKHVLAFLRKSIPNIFSVVLLH